ncbi:MULTISPECIES: hypothetical protein [Streptacidiphilus]|uniref:Uncharacterized protein n=1 Tax=Streptacidiphilus cavernicola TaxID=3342716 RepID=A0ABV6UP67_9ACTN|nr:hypothetical protein [Streptacidiphilus jeojiense]
MTDTDVGVGGGEVPHWCGFFDAGEFEAFCEEFDEACASFGADGQEFDGGRVVLAAGAYLELRTFRLDRLARACREAPQEQWGDLCFDQVCAWSSTDAQEEWLEQVPLDRVRASLRIRLLDGRLRYQGTGPDDPQELFRLPVADGLWAGLVVPAVPAAHDGEPDLDTPVHNAAALAWEASPQALVAAALANLQLEPGVVERLAEPTGVLDSAGCPVVATVVTGGRGSAARLLLQADLEGWSAPFGSMAAVPADDMLVLCAVAAFADRDRIATAVAALARDRIRAAEPGTRVSGDVFWHREGLLSRYLADESATSGGTGL